MAFIYFFSRHQKYLPLVRPFFERAEAGALTVAVSFVVPLEVKVGFKKNANFIDEQRFEDMLAAFGDNLRIVHTDDAIVEIAAALRAKYNIAVADALNLAAAYRRGVDAFFTNDKQLKRVKEIPVRLFEELMLD